MPEDNNGGVLPPLFYIAPFILLFGAEPPSPPAPLPVRIVNQLKRKSL